MVNCDKCGEIINRNDKFCHVCGDEITWPQLSYNEKIEQKTDELSVYLKEKGNEILDDNLPEEYADKVRENISNFKETTKDPERSLIDENEKLSNAKENIVNSSKSIKESSQTFINENDSLNSAKDTILSAGESVKESSTNFINNNVSYDTQEKIKSNIGNLSNSTKNFTSKTSTIFSNIHNHRSNVKQQKSEEKKLKKQQEKAEKEALSIKRDEELLEQQKQREIQKEEDHQNTLIKIRETRTANIAFPKIVNTDNVTTGAIKGEMMGSAAGRAIEGLFGDKNSLSSTLNAGLVLGGAGALLGGLASAADDGLRWDESQLYIDDTELIISGKFSLPFDEIKLVNTGKFKNYDMIVLTLKNEGIEFRTDDALTLKIVIEEYMQQYYATKSKPSNVDELLKYGELYEKGVITKEELDLKKKELL